MFVKLQQVGEANLRAMRDEGLLAQFSARHMLEALE